MADELLKSKIRFLKHAVAFNGKKARVSYSQGAYHKASGLPRGTITIYARDYGQQLPRELFPENDTDFMTDYFDKDRARITPQSKYFKDVLVAFKKQRLL